VETTRWQDRVLPAAAGASLGLGLAARAAVLLPLEENLLAPDLVAERPSLVWFFLALSTGALFGSVLSVWGPALARRGARRVLDPLLLPGLAVLALVPGATTVVPPLAALSGPVLDLLLLGSAAATLWRVAEHFAWRPAATALRVGVFAFVLYLALGWFLQREVGLSGDEPHYLLITQSLLGDADLQIENNYARQDWQSYYSGKIRPHLAQPGRRGARYSIHGAGLPILLLPGFAFFGLAGVLLTEALLGGFLVHQVFRGTELLGGSRGGALFAALGFGATAPALFLSTSAYPELPAALATAVVFRRLLHPSPPAGGAAIGYGLAVGALSFLHAKFLPLGLVLTLALMLQFTRQRRRIAAGFLMAAAAFLVFCLVLFGDPNPAAAYGRQRLFLSGVPRGVLGLLFDQEAGLLPASPFYCFSLVALAGLCAVAPRPGIAVAAVLAAVALPGAAHPLWSGGSSPPARFLFPALPLLAMVAGAGFSRLRRGVSPAITLLIGSVLLGAGMALGPGQPLYLNQRDGSGRIWEALGRSWDLTHYLPSLVIGDSRSLVMASAFGLALVGAMALAFFSRPFRLPPLALVVLAAATCIDWASPGRAALGSAARCRADLLRQLSDLPGARFYSLSSGEPMARHVLLGRLTLPLESPPRLAPQEEEEDEALAARPGATFASAPFFIPAGTYRVTGELSPDALVCNGEGCLGPIANGQPWETRVGLRWFHIRAARAERVAIEALAVASTRFVAQRSWQLGPHLRLHSLDENAFLEPTGFWVRGRSTAILVTEAENAVRLTLSFRNAGENNWVEFDHLEQSERKEQGGGRLRFPLRPWEEKRVETDVPPGLERLAVGSSAVFRPGAGDGRSDRRPLGVFVTASRL